MWEQQYIEMLFQQLSNNSLFICGIVRKLWELKFSVLLISNQGDKVIILVKNVMQPGSQIVIYLQKQTHLRFKQLQPKMYPSPKVEDGVEN